MTKARDDLSVEYVQAAFDYNPLTGDLTWKVRADMAPQWNRKFPGRKAGTVNDRGYVIVAIYKKDFRAHRLIWVMMTGEWPQHEVDHENLIKSDNRWSNLRVATHVQNCRNRPKQSNNKSGFKGVSYCKLTKSWVAGIGVGRRRIVLGRAETPEKAFAFYKNALPKIHGDFSNAGDGV